MWHRNVSASLLERDMSNMHGTLQRQTGTCHHSLEYQTTCGAKGNSIPAFTSCFPSAGHENRKPQRTIKNNASQPAAVPQTSYSKHEISCNVILCHALPRHVNPSLQHKHHGVETHEMFDPFPAKAPPNQTPPQSVYDRWCNIFAQRGHRHLVSHRKKVGRTSNTGERWPLPH